MYNIHKRQPSSLDNEPIHLEARQLTSFSIASADPPASIPDFTEVLRLNEDSYGTPGREKDVQIDINGVRPASNIHTREDEHQSETQQQLPSEITSLPANQPADLMNVESQMFDSFYPFFDPGRLELFPNDVLDLSELASGTSDLAFLESEGWNTAANTI